ncbi:ABC transporter permease [Sulfitobacter sp. M57]|uniref:ABC transporter permease n=1 Tax=unclassified Sulfitobacter TaxID=196795 RepID=UPI0023E0E440|nr:MULTISPECIES: FtsX-like permease family protein [unclassified Sulfitobacter]MDF3413113.1 ABC transporter permease [Sulfitobacter sp. KE5]MDF3421604.1 ABC transporter permease [Sulfitobacter sp. KE43]MDF3431662.1 ABC transporter permease [Sulfitobacter sp. KE42]MDF3457303.1 ABC transporter permease [Sulfitobacter sp. S74]MDF3461205.1 ABC transporter permease [Sulfitobacter sp. Ks18]
MIRACFSALWSHWRRNPVQLFAYLAGLALATALWSGVQAINAEARASYGAAAATLGEGQHDQLVPRQGDRIPQERFIALRRAGWLVSPVTEGRLAGLRLIGIDPVTAPGGLAGLKADQLLTRGTGGAEQVFVNPQTAQEFGGGLAVTLDPDIAVGIGIADIGRVQNLLGHSDLSRLIVLPDQPLGRPDLSAIAPDLRLQAAQQSADIGQLTDSFHLNLTAFGLLSFAVGLFIVHSTIGLAFEQRRGMIRTLRSLGVPLRLLVTLIAVEMMAWAAIGASLGVVAGYLIAALLLPDVAATLRGLYGAEISGTLQIRPEWWLSGLLIALLGTAGALAGRIWQISRMPLLASVRPRAWVMASAARFRLPTLAAAVLLSGALVLALVGQGLFAGFTLLGCLLIGAALALPAVTSVVLSGFEGRARTPLWEWFWADTRQQLPGLSLALMALLLAVSANIGVSTMVSSFRLTFIGFLDQRLAPELFVQVETPEQSTALLGYLDTNAIEVLPLMSVQTRVTGRPTELYGVRVGPTYRENWAFLDARAQPWNAVEAGRAVVVNEQLARRAGLWVGDNIEIDTGVILPIAAVVGDYGNPSGQVVISQTLFQRLHPTQVPLRFGIRTQDASGLRAELSAQFGIAPNAMTDQAAIKALSMQVFERTFTVTAALNALTLMVAGFAILMSLLTLADLRVPQLAPVWALGLTRRWLGWLEVLRAVALAALVFLCAVPLGLALAWVLLSIINVEAFGWQLPMYLFPAEYLWLGIYALGAAVLAALWPALRLMRTPPSALLKVFANER